MRRRNALLRAVEFVRAPIVGALAALGVRPNHLTLLGALVAAGAAYVASQGSLLAAGLLFLAGSLLDGLDGSLARRTGRSSTFGAFLDSFLDRVGEGLLLFGILVYYLSANDDTGAALAFVALFLSFLVSYARARAEGLGLRGTGGPSPRPVRVAVLVLGLLSGLVTGALIVVAALSGASVLWRVAVIWRQARGR